MTTAAIHLEQDRPALTGHCYRRLGSVVDAEDAVQEAMLRAWKSIEGFREQASIKTWLYRIATNVCLDVLSSAERRRLRPLDLETPPGVVNEDLVLTQRTREHWLEPIPDAMAIPAAEDSDPEERAILKESIRLAFVAALQYLPPRQRAVLLLTQVLNWSAAETAEALEMSVAAVNSALQRARATLETRNPAVVPRALTEEQQRLVARYVDAFERYDMEALTALLKQETTMSMPPYELWLRGPDSIARWMTTFGIGCQGSRLVPAGTVGGMPAFAQYKRGGEEPWSIVVLDVGTDGIENMTFFLDTETLFPRFGVPMRLS
ncbi:MAG: sigma-70 family RNA polymerase sigma factor [Gemmatimonadaceae bacterium]